MIRDRIFYRITLWALLTWFLPHQGELRAQTANDPFVKVHLLDSLGKYEKALAALDEVPQDASFAYRVGMWRTSLLYRIGRYDEAMSQASTMVDAWPDSLAPWMERASQYTERVMLLRAEEDLRQGMRRCRSEVDSASVMVNLGAAYSMAMDFRRGLDVLDSSLHLRPDDLGALLNKSNCLAHLGRWSEAKELLIKLDRDHPSDLVVLNNLGFGCSDNDEHAEALTWFEKAAMVSPDDAVVLNNLGYAQLMTGSVKEARKSVARSIALRPGNSYAHRNMALIEIAEGHTDKACDALEEALRRGFTEQFGPEVGELRKKHCK